jgi:hypothetical protein
MTPQDIFDTVTRHLVTQGKPARRGRWGKCAYRGEDGCKCAVGVLIPDEMYVSEMDDRDNTAIRDLVGSGDLTFPDYFARNLTLLGALQHAHDDTGTNEDGTFDRSDLRASLLFVARTRDLSTTVLDALLPETATTTTESSTQET